VCAGDMKIPAPYRIRKARADEFERLQEVERRAARMFAEVGLGGITDDDATALEDFAHCHEHGLLWVAADESDRPVGFAFVEMADRQPHLDEIDVDPDHSRRGLGRAMVEAVAEWARQGGYRSLTLTTFRDVPWNMPFYARLGFQVLPAAEQGPELRALVDAETRRGLPVELRVVMRRALRSSAQ